MHRLKAFVQMTAIDNLSQRTNDVSLEPKIHCQIGVLPVSQHAHPHEVIPLLIHLLGGVLPALLAELTGAHLVAGLADFLFDIQFDRESMAIPTGHVRCIVSREGS